MTEVWLVVREGPVAGSEHPVDDSLILGRDNSADLVLDDAGISRRHAAVEVAEAEVVVEDLGSSNGTFVNGTRVERSLRLGQGDLIQLGATVLEVRFSDDRTRVVPAAAPTEVSPAPRAAERQGARAEPPPGPAAEPSGARSDSNWPALAAVVLGPLSILLLAFTSGALFYVALPCAVAAVALGTMGRSRVDRGESARFRGLAVAGRTFGVVGAVLAIVVLLILVAVNAALDAGVDSLRGVIDELRAEIEGGASDIGVPEIESPQPAPAPEAPQ